MPHLDCSSTPGNNNNVSHGAGAANSNNKNNLMSSAGNKSSVVAKTRTGGTSGGGETAQTTTEDVTSDEVRVYTEEGTEETEKRDSERGLDEEKNSLVNITDSATGKDANAIAPTGVDINANKAIHHDSPPDPAASFFHHHAHHLLHPHPGATSSSIFGAGSAGSPFNNFVSRYRNESGKFDPASLYGTSEAFRYFMPPYPPNGYPMV